MKYSDLSIILKQEIRKCIDSQYAGLVALQDTGSPLFGEFSTNIAMVLAKHLKKSPAIIAQEIKDKLEKSPEFPKYFNTVIPGPAAYINFFIRAEFFPKLVQEIADNPAFGRGEPKNKKILLEFLSANPTGPMHLGNGRGGFTGDCLANILEWAGYVVWREYYINDIGVQIERLGESILYAATGETKADVKNLYQAPYIHTLEEELKPRAGASALEVGKQAALQILEGIKRVTEEKMRIRFNRWFSEEHLYDNKKGMSKTQSVLKALAGKNIIYPKDGAQWFMSSKFGDEKDRVLIKSDNDKTYALSDIAYHKDKFDRGYDKLINIWGADHHGYIGRTYAAVEALGYKKEQLDIILVQLVRLVENGIEVKMSKRGGTFVTIEELIDEVGHDVVRFFFVMRAPETHMDFDLNLAKEQSSKNPVYYVQYAHARICSILMKVQNSSPKANLSPRLMSLGFTPLAEKLKGADEYSPNSYERILAAHLLRFPDIIEETAKTYAVHHLPAYAIKLADLFHRFYEHCRVIEDDKVNEERLKIIKASQIVLKNVLTVIGVGAPERM